MLSSTDTEPEPKSKHVQVSLMLLPVTPMMMSCCHILFVFMINSLKPKSKFLYD
jgi:hypothetical protein